MRIFMVEIQVITDGRTSFIGVMYDTIDKANNKRINSHPVEYGAFSYKINGVVESSIEKLREAGLISPMVDKIASQFGGYSEILTEFYSVSMFER